MDKQSAYTAQEMREMATVCQNNADCLLTDVEAEGGCAYQPLCKNDVNEYSTIADMLRQAADAEDELAKLSESKNRWMQYQETAAGERNACIDELRKKDAEIAQLKTRLEAVVKECDDINKTLDKQMKESKRGGFEIAENSIAIDKVIVARILSAARGGGSAAQRA